jgi:hypothetical protein
MKTGTNYITTLATDISGAGVTGLTSGWSVEGEIEGNSIVTITSTAAASGGDGFYIHSIDLPAGQGYVTIRNSTSGVYITPDYFDLEVTSADVDDVYSVVQQQTVSPVPYDYSTRYGEYTISIKEADDFYEVMNVPLRYLPLTGWTNWTVQAYPEEKLLVGSTPAISGGAYSCSVISNTLGTLQVGISKEIFTNRIPDGVASIPIYADIQAHDSNSKKRTVVTIKFVINREFNSNS